MGLLSASEDGMTKIWRAGSGELVVSMIAFGEHDWIVFAPDGLFDGSPVAWHKIIWRFNNNTLDYAPADTFFSDFYHQGLLTDIFAGKHPNAPPNISHKERRQP